MAGGTSPVAKGKAETEPMLLRSPCTSATFLLVEDDPAISRMLMDVLGHRGYQVWHATSWTEAEGVLGDACPDLIILDLLLPGANGLVLCADLKAAVDVPIIICSATKRKEDQILAFKLGADDFIAKPFSPEELIVRAEAGLRRTRMRHQAEAATRSGRLKIGQLVIDGARCRVTIRGEILQLTPTEHRLLIALAGRAGEVVSRENLAQCVWGHDDPDIGRSLDVHMRRLRAKLEAMQGPTVSTVRGFGYRIAPAADGAVAATATMASLTTGQPTDNRRNGVAHLPPRGTTCAAPRRHEAAGAVVTAAVA